MAGGGGPLRAGVYLIQMGEKEFGMVCIFNGLGLVGIGSKVEKARVYPVNINLNGQQDKPQ